jgi:GntR family transcriptional regulator of arabinose operon
MSNRPTKNDQIFEHLRRAIRTGVYKQGDRLPADQQIGKQFGASRPTVAKALNELQSVGLVERRVGSGTYVTYESINGDRLMLGLIIPNLGETEIFEPICGAMAEQAETYSADLLWSGQISNTAMDPKRQALDMCDRYIDQGVGGVFFAPMELDEESESINQQIVDKLVPAGVQIVLLDRDHQAYPERSDFDLIGIDNFDAGFRATEHLLEAGSRRIVFLARPQSVSTVHERVFGFRSALMHHDAVLSQENLIWMDPEDAALADRFRSLEADGIICANDATAASLIKNLQSNGISVPGDLRVVGFDDVKYARLLSPSLTSVRQPCASIAAVAMNTMKTRLEQPRLPARTVRLRGELVVRESSGQTQDV